MCLRAGGGAVAFASTSNTFTVRRGEFKTRVQRTGHVSAQIPWRFGPSEAPIDTVGPIIQPSKHIVSSSQRAWTLAPC